MDDVSNDRLIELYKMVIEEDPKPADLTPAEKASWNRLSAHVAEIIRQHPDAVLDIPF